MSKLLMLSGLPASGKSTYASELVKGGGNWVRVNRDLLRTMLHFDKWSGKNEQNTIDAEREIVAWFIGRKLKEKCNVVVDDTNLGEKHKEFWKKVAGEWETNFEHKHFDTDMYTCIERDEVRDKRVGEYVIKKMAMQYGLFPDMENIVVCDIDGTVADCEHRRHHLDGEKNWKGFFDAMDKDPARMDVYNQVHALAKENNAKIVFVTARPEDYRGMTESWLKSKCMDYDAILMRPNRNSRPDTEIKQQILDKYLKKYNIIKVFDDRPSVIRMWQENGLGVVDCGEGIEF